MARLALILSLLTIFLQGRFSSGDARSFILVNKCTYTVWPAATTFSIGFSLPQGESKSLNLGSSNNGRLWGRTQCDNNSTGTFVCKTGDCGSGKSDCSGMSPQNSNPTTLVEFSTGFQSADYYDVSLTNGYNLPILVVPSSSGCSATGCIFDVENACPAELKLGSTCSSACQAFNNKDFCCNGGGTCNATEYSRIFKKACPRAYSYSLDDDTSTFTCPGTPNYTLTFCPSHSAMVSAFSKAGESPPLSTPSPSPSPSPAKANVTTKTTDGHSPSVLVGDSEKKRRRRLHTSFLVVIPILTTILLSLGILICIYKRKKAIERYNVEMDETRTVESLQFNLHTIRTATSNFSAHNKLGEGGFGEVYKGKLDNGQEVAVKRLSKTSGQGVGEFRTEIALVAKLQHKNLVKLLGFCVASKEKILVYEYLPNSSLDKFLFDPTKSAALDWQTRLKIMLGIARGLLYLHEDSRLKVIHRDLKTSNILLDDTMNPKISDFGLAKLFGVDQTQGDTNRIVGTYGYMAPEYAITGHFSVKSDVYSFGVIMLEMVSGQKNKFFGRVQLEEALLHRAWRLWNERKAMDLVDTTLIDNIPTEEVLKCIQIGLLCIQEDAAERPRVTSIVAALSGQSIDFPMPKPPHFFGRTTNVQDPRMLDQQSSPCNYTGAMTITDLYSRE